MDALGYLFLFLIIASGGFFLGVLFQRSGRTLPEDLRRMLPVDRQGQLNTFTLGAGFLVALYVFVLLTTHEEMFPPFFLLFFLPTWVYLDARERGGRALAWGLLTLFTQPLGFAAYLITRPEKPRSCPRCDYKLRDEFTVCPYCGPQAGLTCGNCQAVLEPTWRYCPYCQVSVTPPDPASPATDRPSPYGGEPMASIPHPASPSMSSP